MRELRGHFRRSLYASYSPASPTISIVRPTRGSWPPTTMTLRHRHATHNNTSEQSHTHKSRRQLRIPRGHSTTQRLDVSQAGIEPGYAGSGPLMSTVLCPSSTVYCAQSIHRLPSAINVRPPSTVHRLPSSTARRPLSTVHRPPPVVHRPPSTSVHRLPSTAVHRPPPAVHCPPSIVHRPSSTVHRLLSTVYLPSIIHRPLSVVLRPPSTATANLPST